MRPLETRRGGHDEVRVAGFQRLAVEAEPLGEPLVVQRQAQAQGG